MFINKTILGVLLAVACICLQKYYLDPPVSSANPPDSTTTKQEQPQAKASKASSDRLFTKEELALHTGENSKYPPYLAVFGDVFDVSTKAHIYGPGGSYHFFTGKDGSRAFATGKFNAEGLIDSVEGLSHSDIAAIDDWNKVYKRDYKWIGKLIGTYYDSEGKATDAKKNLQVVLKQHANKEQDEKELRKSMPLCNMKYSAEHGRTLWCESGSGGIERNWAGHPRQRMVPGKGTECVCVQEKLFDDPSLDVYEGCATKSNRCDWDKNNKPVKREGKVL